MSWINKLPPLSRTQVLREIARTTGLEYSTLKFHELTECDLRGAVGNEYEAPFISINCEIVDRELLTRFDAQQLVSQSFIPLFQEDENVFCATSCPWNVFMRDTCQNVLGAVEVSIFQVTEGELLGIFEQFNLSKTDYSRQADKVTIEETSLRERVSLSPEEASAWGVLSQLFIEGLAKRATDIHLHPEPETIRVRATINGTLQDLKELPRSMSSTLEHVLYNQTQTMFGQNRMKPQDGHFSFEFPPGSGRKVDLRLASLPIFDLSGEIVSHITIRVQDSQRNDHLTLESLGFPQTIQQKVFQAIASPGALCIVAGPTGSGKTTTLGACLKHLNTSDRCIYSVEDPVENIIPGVTHIAVKNEVTFATVIRSLLRKAPHVIMVGEIRDQETARLVMEAALTGHTVLTTLHADYSTEIPERLTYVGVDPWQVASKLELCSSQRLLKVLCPHCAREQLCTAEMIENLGYPTQWEGRSLRTRSPDGCEGCHQTGYHDRRAIIEVLPMNDVLREMIINHAHSHALRRYAIQELKMKTLRELALEEIAKGVTDYGGVAQVVRLQGVG